MWRSRRTMYSLDLMIYLQVVWLTCTVRMKRLLPMYQRLGVRTQILQNFWLKAEVQSNTQSLNLITFPRLQISRMGLKIKRLSLVLLRLKHLLITPIYSCLKMLVLKLWFSNRLSLCYSQNALKWRRWPIKKYKNDQKLRVLPSSQCTKFKQCNNKPKS